MGRVSVIPPKLKRAAVHRRSQAIGGWASCVLTAMALTSCAPTLRYAPFAQSVDEDEMSVGDISVRAPLCVGARVLFF